MSMSKTLGGDRLGSGKKMKVELHNYERSTHDMGYVWRSSMSAGTLVPFLCEVALPGDTFDINLGCEIRTLPTVGPLFGSYKVQLDIFQAPIRLYQALLHNNQLGIGKNMSAVKLPQIEFTATPIDGLLHPDIDNCQINPSTLPAYLGLRGIGNPGVTTAGRQFNAVPYLAYWEIYKNYYANKQEEIGAVIHADQHSVAQTVTEVRIVRYGGGDSVVIKVPPGALTQDRLLNVTDRIRITYSGTKPDPRDMYFVNDTAPGTQSIYDLGVNWIDVSATVMEATFNKEKYGEVAFYGWNYSVDYNVQDVAPRVVTFPLSNIDDMRMDILADSSGGPFVISAGTSAAPYVYLCEQPNGVPNILVPQEGLALKTYQSDLFNNWLKTENIDAISSATAIDTSGGSFTIDQLVLSKKVYNMLNRINVSGGSYDDWIDAVYVHDRYQRAESPIYHGGLIKELVFQEVVSNAQSTEQPLGTLAGKGVMASKHKGGTVVIRVDEPSYLIGIISLTPRVDYSQGNKWDVNLKTMDDFHKPQLDEIGFQELVTEQMAWWETYYAGAVWNQKSAGKQPAWLNYMTNVNVTRGNFAMKEKEMFMTLNRRYENYQESPEIEDLTTYIDPSKFNYIFAETSLDAQNFWAQIAVDITARRKMSAKIMPNL